MNPNLPVSAVITGATGWLGRGLIHGLLNGVNGCPNLKKETGLIRVLVKPGEKISDFQCYGDRVQVVFGDICNPDDCKYLLKNTSGAFLYHTAGIIHPKFVKEFYRINLFGTSTILHAAQLANIKRVIVVSSNSPVGCNLSADQVFDEDSPFNPYMHYGRSKMMMEQEVARIQETGKIETVLIRAPWFYGPFQPARQTLFFRMIKEGKFPIIGNGENKRSMVYIENLVQGMILAAHSEIAKGKVYWIADEYPYSMNKIVCVVESVLEEDFKIACAHKRIYLPNAVSEIAFIFDKFIQGIGLYNQKIHVLSEMNKSIACSIELAKLELEYRPKVALREGIQNSIAWMVENQIQI